MASPPSGGGGGGGGVWGGVDGCGAYPRRVRTVHSGSPRGGGSSPSREGPCAVAGREARLGWDVAELGYMVVVEGRGWPRVHELKRLLFLDLSMVDRRLHDDLRKIFLRFESSAFRSPSTARVALVPLCGRRPGTSAVAGRAHLGLEAHLASGSAGPIKLELGCTLPCRDGSIAQSVPVAE
jgi:hypothetical protein